MAHMSQLPPAARAHEQRFGRPLGDVLLQDMREWSLADLAREFDVTPKTMLRWLDLLGIERRLVLVPRHGADATATGASAAAQDEQPAGSRS